jgi:hypothetical protein
MRLTVVSCPDEEDEQHRHQLAVGEPVAFLFGLDAGRHQVILGVGAAAADEVLEVADHLLAALGGAGGGVRVLGVARRERDLRGGCTEEAALGGRDAEHLADDGDGEGVGEVRDRVHLALGSASSSSSSTIVWMRGCSWRTARGVNALLTSVRRRAWRGGSEPSMLALGEGPSPWTAERRTSSRRRRLTSSCLATSQVPRTASKWTGSDSRRSR